MTASIRGRRPDYDSSTLPGVAITPELVRTVGRFFAAVLVLLAVGHVVALMFPSVPTLDFLNLGFEEGVGTWVSSLLHAGCAALSAFGALLARREGSRWARNWWLLAAVFLAISIDETAAIHDRLVRPLRDAFGTTGVLYYPWVGIALVLGAVFLVLQLGFLRHLGNPTRRNLVLAGVVFVTGAAGLEMVEGVVASQGAGEDSVYYLLLVMVEELLEVGAVMWVICILLSHLSRWLDQPRLTFVPTTDEVAVR